MIRPNTQMATIAGMFRTGMAPVEIADALNMCGKQVNRVIYQLRELGELPPAQGRTNNRLTDEQRARIVELSHTHSNKQIAAELGVRTHAVAYWIEQARLNPERLGPAPAAPLKPQPGQQAPCAGKPWEKPREVPGIYFRTCQFIAGEPTMDAPRCGEPTEGGKAWCAHHHKIVWRPLARERDEPGFKPTKVGRLTISAGGYRAT